MLSEREREALAALERHLDRDDPGFARSFRLSGPPRTSSGLARDCRAAAASLAVLFSIVTLATGAGQFAIFFAAAAFYLARGIKPDADSFGDAERSPRR